MAPKALGEDFPQESSTLVLFHVTPTAGYSTMCVHDHIIRHCGLFCYLIVCVLFFLGDVLRCSVMVSRDDDAVTVVLEIKKIVKLRSLLVWAFLHRQSELTTK